jgi:hypothetical protein
MSKNFRSARDALYDTTTLTVTSNPTLKWLIKL